MTEPTPSEPSLASWMREGADMTVQFLRNFTSTDRADREPSALTQGAVTA